MPRTPLQDSGENRGGWQLGASSQLNVSHCSESEWAEGKVPHMHLLGGSTSRLATSRLATWVCFYLRKGQRQKEVLILHPGSPDFVPASLPSQDWPSPTWSRTGASYRIISSSVAVLQLFCIQSWRETSYPTMPLPCLKSFPSFSLLQDEIYTRSLAYFSLCT